MLLPGADRVPAVLDARGLALVVLDVQVSVSVVPDVTSITITSTAIPWLAAPR